MMMEATVTLSEDEISTILYHLESICAASDATANDDTMLEIFRKLETATYIPI